MTVLRALCIPLFFALLPGAATAQIKASVPSGDQGSYNPQLSAKEAVLVNWKLATSGILAGKYVADQVAQAAPKDHAKLAAQAQFAAETMLLRYASSYWLFAMDEALTPVQGDVLRAAHLASHTSCETGCDDQIATLQAAFAEASTAFDAAAQAAQRQAETRAVISDTAALFELLTDMATYLESDAWHQNLSLAGLGLDGKEVSARVIGTLAVWRNIEPFVGLRSAEIDAAVNATSDRLLRDVRRNTRRKADLPADSAEIATIRTSAIAVAAELRRAAALFQEG